jgi:hypothetical protein
MTERYGFAHGYILSVFTRKDDTSADLNSGSGDVVLRIGDYNFIL